MPFGIGAGQAFGLVRQVRGLEATARPLLVTGPLAEVLARELSAGGDTALVPTSGDPAQAAALVCVLAGAPVAGDVAHLRAAARARVPVVVVQMRAPAGRVPYVFATDVVEVPPGEGFPVAQIAKVVARVLGDAAVPLASSLPTLRAPVRSRLVRRSTVVNAAIGAAPWVQRAHLPLLVLGQARMLLELATAGGRRLPHDPQRLALAAGPPLAGALGAGLALRGLYRRLPVRGPLVGGGIAAAGTAVLGELGARTLDRL